MASTIGTWSWTTRLGVAVAALAAATCLATGSAAAEAPQAPAGASYDCGYTDWWMHSTYVQGYNHCGPTSVRIHVDVRGGGTTNDYNLCVAPGLTPLSYSASVLNANYIGGAGCRVGERT